jgi:flagellar protein FliO/FliZ
MTPASLVGALLALLGVIGLILLARRAALLLPTLRLGGLGGAVGAAGPLGLEQAIALDARRRLLLVRAGARRVLLLTGGPQDVVVGWLDAPSENPETSHDTPAGHPAAAARQRLRAVDLA